MLTAQQVIPWGGNPLTWATPSLLPHLARKVNQRIARWVLDGQTHLPDCVRPESTVLDEVGRRLVLVAALPDRVGSHEAWRLVLQDPTFTTPWLVVGAVRYIPEVGLVSLTGRTLLPAHPQFMPQAGDLLGETTRSLVADGVGAELAGIEVGDTVHLTQTWHGISAALVIGRRGPWLRISLPSGGEDLVHVDATGTNQQEAQHAAATIAATPASLLETQDRRDLSAVIEVVPGIWAAAVTTRAGLLALGAVSAMGTLRLPEDHLVGLGERLRQITAVFLQEQRARVPKRRSRQTAIASTTDSEEPFEVTVCA